MGKVHKIRVLIKDEEYDTIFPEESLTLMEAIYATITQLAPDNLVFAITVDDEDAEFYGNEEDEVDFELFSREVEEDDEFEFTLDGKVTEKKLLN